MAIQSVDSTLVAELAGLRETGFCCCTWAETGVGCSEEVALRGCTGGRVCDCEGGFCGGGGGGVCDEEDKWWVLVKGCERNGGEPKKEAMFDVGIEIIELG